METNNIDPNSEFEQMREQLDIMKRKLKQQEIINDNLISQAMSDRMSWIKKYVWVEAFVLIPVIILMYIPIVHVFGISWWIYVLIVLSCIVDTYFDYRINKINPADWLADNLVETGRKLVEMKRRRLIQFVVSVTSIIVIMGLFGYELMTSSCGLLADDAIVRTGTTIGFSIGVVIGLVVAYVIFRRMQRTNDTLIRQIDEMSKGHDDSDVNVCPE